MPSLEGGATIGSMRARRAFTALAIGVTGLAITVPAGAVCSSLSRSRAEATTFRIEVVASAGFTFTECLRFDQPGQDGVRADLLGPGSWESLPRGTYHARFAVDDVVIDLNGQVRRDGTMIGTGTNSNGRTYVYDGVADPGCELPPEEG